MSDWHKHDDDRRRTQHNDVTYDPNAMKQFSFVKMRLALKRAVWQWSRQSKSILRNRTVYGPDVSKRRRRPWLWRSCAWRARCMWRHRGWRSPGILWERHGSPRRWDQRFALLHLGERDDELPAWWFPGCYHAKPCDDAWATLSQSFSSFAATRHDSEYRMLNECLIIRRRRLTYY